MNGKTSKLARRVATTFAKEFENLGTLKTEMEEVTVVKNVRITGNDGTVQVVPVNRTTLRHSQESWKGAYKKAKRIFKTAFKGATA